MRGFRKELEVRSRIPRNQLCETACARGGLRGMGGGGARRFRVTSPKTSSTAGAPRGALVRNKAARRCAKAAGPKKLPEHAHLAERAVIRLPRCLHAAKNGLEARTRNELRRAGEENATARG